MLLTKKLEHFKSKKYSIIYYKRQLNLLCISELKIYLFAIMLPLGHEAKDKMIDTQKARKKNIASYVIQISENIK